MSGPPASGRIAQRFEALAAEGRAAFVPFITAGDPDHETCAALLARLPAMGADLIELGVPFTDPMADGPAIQASGLRALSAGASLSRTLDLVRGFRQGGDQDTPIVLMGYFNPIHAFGAERFVAGALEAGVDGLIIVDLPPEESDALAGQSGLDIIRLATPTTDAVRLPRVLEGASGFLYYVAVTGVTGDRSAAIADLEAAVGRLKSATSLPVGVGFGIRSPDQAEAVASFADAVIVGSAITSRIAEHLDSAGRATPDLVDQVSDFVGTMAAACRTARKPAGQTRG